MAEWQPIETAPKDGTPILAFAQTRIRIVRFREAFIGRPDWRDDGGHSRYPTHWMPLPAFPHIEGETQ